MRILLPNTIQIEFMHLPDGILAKKIIGTPFCQIIAANCVFQFYAPS